MYEDTLILAGVQASLSASPNLEVIVLDPALDSPANALRGLHPVAVIFDLESLADLPLAFVQQPGLLLIGVDASSSEMLVLSGWSSQVFSAADLASAISQQDAVSETNQKGDMERTIKQPERTISPTSPKKDHLQNHL